MNSENAGPVGGDGAPHNGGDEGPFGDKSIAFEVPMTEEVEEPVMEVNLCFKERDNAHMQQVAILSAMTLNVARLTISEIVGRIDDWDPEEGSFFDNTVKITGESDELLREHFVDEDSLAEHKQKTVEIMHVAGCLVHGAVAMFEGWALPIIRAAMVQELDHLDEAWAEFLAEGEVDGDEPGAGDE